MSDPRFPPVQVRGGLDPYGQTNDFIDRPRDELGLRFRKAQGPGVVQVQDRHRSAFLRGSTKYNVGTSSLLVLGDPTGVRNLLFLSNVSTGAQIIFIEYGDEATLESPIRLAPGETMVCDTVVPQDRINAISDTAGARLTVAQSQYSP